MRRPRRSRRAPARSAPGARLTAVGPRAGGRPRAAGRPVARLERQIERLRARLLGAQSRDFGRRAAHRQRRARRRRLRDERLVVRNRRAEERQLAARIGRRDGAGRVAGACDRDRPASAIGADRRRGAVAASTSDRSSSGLRSASGRIGELGDGGRRRQRKVIPAIAAALDVLEPEIAAFGALHGTRRSLSRARGAAAGPGTGAASPARQLALDVGAQAIGVGLLRIGRANRFERVSASCKWPPASARARRRIISPRRGSRSVPRARPARPARTPPATRNRRQRQDRSPVDRGSTRSRRRTPHRDDRASTIRG